MGRGRLIVAGGLIVVAILYLIVTSTADTALYYVTVSELQEMDGAAAGRRITVAGAVLGDSIVYDPSLPRVTFTIVEVPADPQEVTRAGGLAAALHAAVQAPDAPRLEVVLDDVKPDLLINEAQAIARGRLGPDGRFQADEVLLKCPSRYDEGGAAQAARVGG